MFVIPSGTKALVTIGGHLIIASAQQEAGKVMGLAAYGDAEEPGRQTLAERCL